MQFHEFFIALFFHFLAHCALYSQGHRGLSKQSNSAYLALLLQTYMREKHHLAFSCRAENTKKSLNFVDFSPLKFQDKKNMKNPLKKSCKLLKSISLSESRTNITDIETSIEKSNSESLEHECDKIKSPDDGVKILAGNSNSKNLAGNSNIPSSLIPMTEEDKEKLEIVLFNQQLQGVGLSDFMIDI